MFIQLRVPLLLVDKMVKRWKIKEKKVLFSCGTYTRTCRDLSSNQFRSPFTYARIRFEKTLTPAIFFSPLEVLRAHPPNRLRNSFANRRGSMTIGRFRIDDCASLDYWDRATRFYCTDFGWQSVVASVPFLPSRTAREKSRTGDVKLMTVWRDEKRLAG